MLALGKNISNNGGTLMSTQLTIQNVADWFLSKESMTHKKLQKLCYYAVAWGYTLMDDEIVNNGEFQAWVHGPVSPTLYAKYKDNGWNSLPQPRASVEVPSDAEEVLQAVWLTYGDKGGNELEALSHSEEPWIKARGTLAAHESSTAPIDPDVMKVFYTSIKSTEY